MNASAYENATTPPSRDAGLLLRLRAGEEAAYQELVRANAGRMLAVARRMLRCDSDAEDAVQEAFTQAYHALPRFEGHALLSTWLHRIVVNACLIRLRKRKRRGERSLEELMPQFQEDGHRLDVGEPWPHDALAQLEAREVRAAVRKAIDSLPERHRCVLMLRDIEGLPSEEVAERLGIRADAVKMKTAPGASGASHPARPAAGRARSTVRQYITCRELIEFLDRYVDGELPAPMAAKFEEHLEVCAACVEYLHSYRETIRLASEAWSDDEIAIEDVPSELIDAILAVRERASTS